MNAQAKKQHGHDGEEGAAEEVVKHGFDGNAPFDHVLRDLPGAEKNRVLIQKRRFDTLFWLKEKKHINEEHFLAGEELREAWHGCQISGAAPSWENFGGSKGAYTGLGSGTVGALGRFGEAWAQVHEFCRPSIALMVLENLSKDQVALVLKMDRRAILPHIRIGLDQLAAHYGFKITAPIALPGRRY